ncbi:MAG: serine hydrolase [Actinomycetota bacterium]
MSTNEAFSDAPVPFSGEPMHEYFCRVGELGASVTIAAAPTPQPWPVGPPINLPERFTFRKRRRYVEDVLTETDTAALLVLQRGELRYERYELTGGPTVPWMSMSVAKSFISALVGIAAAEGLIGSLSDPVSDYLPLDAASAYHGVAVADVLSMSSGVRWSEDYADPESDIFLLAAVLHGQGTFDGFVAGRKREFSPGTVCRYNTTDTQALAWLLAETSGTSVSEYMATRLLHPMGQQDPAQWLVDDAGREAVGYGLNMSARDYARLGELYRNGGRWNGRQLVPADHVAASTTLGKPHTHPGQVRMCSEQWRYGYGFQWWLPEVDPGEFVAIGVYNQFIYVHPPSETVIVKLSANRTYGTSPDEETNRDLENVMLLRSIARSIA